MRKGERKEGERVRRWEGERGEARCQVPDTGCRMMRQRAWGMGHRVMGGGALRLRSVLLEQLRRIDATDRTNLLYNFGSAG